MSNAVVTYQTNRLEISKKEALEKLRKKPFTTITKELKRIAKADSATDSFITLKDGVKPEQFNGFSGYFRRVGEGLRALFAKIGHKLKKILKNIEEQAKNSGDAAQIMSNAKNDVATGSGDTPTTVPPQPERVVNNNAVEKTYSQANDWEAALDFFNYGTAAEKAVYCTSDPYVIPPCDKRYVPLLLDVLNNKHSKTSKETYLTVCRNISQQYQDIQKMLNGYFITLSPASQATVTGHDDIKVFVARDVIKQLYLHKHPDDRKSKKGSIDVYNYNDPLTDKPTRDSIIDTMLGYEAHRLPDGFIKTKLIDKLKERNIQFKAEKNTDPVSVEVFFNMSYEEKVRSYHLMQVGKSLREALEATKKS